jgi:hypothetical protein
MMRTILMSLVGILIGTCAVSTIYVLRSTAPAVPGLPAAADSTGAVVAPVPGAAALADPPGAAGAGASAGAPKLSAVDLGRTDAVPTIGSGVADTRTPGGSAEARPSGSGGTVSMPAAAASRPPANSVAANAGASGAERLARIFAAMKPEDAAKVLEELEDRDVRSILVHLGDRRAAAILGHLTPERAANLSRWVIEVAGERP